MIKDLVLKNRSYRRFYEDVTIARETLEELVDLARLSGLTANRQPLKYILSCDSQKNALIFPHLKWAGYLKDWPGPSEGERPSAYIIILADTEINRIVDWDYGIVAQSILLGAVEMGLGGCMLMPVRAQDLSKTLNIPTHYDILLVIALGKPKETVVIEPVGPDGDIKYWRDEKGVHHVPKRSLDELIIDL